MIAILFPARKSDFPLSSPNLLIMYDIDYLQSLWMCQTSCSIVITMTSTDLGHGRVCVLFHVQCAVTLWLIFIILEIYVCVLMPTYSNIMCFGFHIMWIDSVSVVYFIIYIMYVNKCSRIIRGLFFFPRFDRSRNYNHSENQMKFWARSLVCRRSWHIALVSSERVLSP